MKVMFTKIFSTNKKHQPKVEIHVLARTAASQQKKTFSKSDTTNWSNKFCETTEIVNDTILGYKNNQLPERYHPSLLKKSQLTLNESYGVMKKSGIT